MPRWSAREVGRSRGTAGPTVPVTAAVPTGKDLPGKSPESAGARRGASRSGAGAAGGAGRSGGRKPPRAVRRSPLRPGGRRLLPGGAQAPDALRDLLGSGSGGGAQAEVPGGGVGGEVGAARGGGDGRAEGGRGGGRRWGG